MRKSKSSMLYVHAFVDRNEAEFAQRQRMSQEGLKTLIDQGLQRMAGLQWRSGLHHDFIGGVRMKQKRAALYIRVSSGDQKTEAQEQALREYVHHRGWVLHKVYKDHGVSGSLGSRPALDELMKEAQQHSRPFDVVLVWKFDRFARSLKTLISALELFKALKIDFVSITESVDTSLPSGELVFQIFGAVAQFERSLIGERVRAGLRHAKQQGTVLGRRPLRVLTTEEVTQIRKDRRDKMTFRAIAEKYGVTVWTAHHLCARRKEIGG